jgi:hypothetical protein
MCWKSKTKPKLQTAKENIVVYKVVRLNKNIIESFTKRFCYKLKRKYELPALDLLFIPPDLFVSDACYVVHEGFHSYNIYADALLQHELVRFDPFSYVKTAVVECIIPKGSKYYRNETETVSNAIIIAKILD